MRLTMRILKVASGIVVLGLIGLTAWLSFHPPDLLRVGSGYSAKIVCSNLFIARRAADEVLAVDVQAPGHPLLKLMRVSVDHEQRRVHAALLGLFAGSDAVYRDGLGCAVTPTDTVAAIPALANLTPIAADHAVLWPEGDKIEPNQAVAAVLSDNTLAGPGMRAVVVVQGGRVIGERYATGFYKETPLLGWSMTKTVNAAIIGTLIRDGRLALDATKLFPQWGADQRGDIKLGDLLAMESGLVFNENYGTVADVTRMLYLERDMAEFAADQPLEADPGTLFSYSSGTPVMLAKLWMDRVGDRAKALAYPHKALFGPIGMASAVMEIDAAGTFVAGSYMYATARDWARFGMFLAHDGVWHGTRILPEGFVGLMQQPNGHSSGRYSKMQTWLPPKNDSDIPADAFILQGHDGQTVTVVPSLDLVVVRMGLTPSWNRHDPTRIVAAIIKTTKAP